MRVSLILNTACGDAMTAGNRNPYRSRRYGERAEILRETLKQVQQDTWDEIIVAGVYPKGLVEEFPDVEFVEVPPVRHNRWDGLAQREAGARFASGDLLVFCHDDHSPEEGFARRLRDLAEGGWDILVPKRMHAETGATLNNGKDDGYMGGHCYVMRRWIWAALPLTSAPDEWWDIYLTPRWQKLGARIEWTNKLAHWDEEATAEEE